MKIAGNPAGRIATVVLLALTVVLVACSGPLSGSRTTATVATTSTPAASASASTATVTPGTTATPSPTATQSAATASATVPTPTATGIATIVPVGTPTASGGVTPSTYLDDRSTPAELIRSYYNAINMKQYARAYFYWEDSQRPTFDQFQQGYATTQSVDVTIGGVGVGAAAGNLYFSIPVVIKSHTTDKGSQTFVGCYTAHLGQPANQAVPPFQPMAIQSAKIVQIDSGTDPQSAMGQACNGQPGAGSPGTVTPNANPDDVSASNYLDNRSDGAEVVRSYYNAINRKEYARAYSYWEPNLPATTLAPFDQFQQGYSDTKSVSLTIGKVTYDAGAGQRYAMVPTTIVASMTDGSTQTFVGCYVAHLASPDIQTSPPFQPMSISRASVSKVANNADTNAMMATACQQ